MKNSFYLLFSFLFLSTISCAQQIETNASCTNPAFDKKVKRLLNLTVTPITPDELKVMGGVLLLDIREKEEYDVSHIEGAEYMGYEEYDADLLNEVPKNTPIVVYCSIGYRSEKVGEKIQKLGFTEVYNLYGSIFEWVNQDNPVVDNNNKPTDKIHTYNKNWSKWVQEGKAIKVW
ncbi:MAG: rhodanese-related sulfurtransferase [Polaribacter sp.]|jgi:rhodanese-related sulfurtransferase